MADFIIVIAAMAGLAVQAPASDAAASARATAVPLDAPTMGFRTYPDVASCEQAASNLVAPAGRRLVCLPVEPLAGEMSKAY